MGISAVYRTERFDPEGSNSPKGEWRFGEAESAGPRLEQRISGGDGARNWIESGLGVGAGNGPGSSADQREAEEADRER